MLLCLGLLDSLAPRRRHPFIPPSSLLCLPRALHKSDASIVRHLSALCKRMDLFCSLIFSPCPSVSARSDGTPTRAAKHGRFRGNRGAGCSLHCRPDVCGAAAHHLGKFQLHMLIVHGHGPLVRVRREEQDQGALSQYLSRLLHFYIQTNQSIRRRRSSIVTTGGGPSGAATCRVPR